MAAVSQRLRVSYESQSEFLKEYEDNVSKGGIFVHTDEGFDVRTRVCVLFELLYCKTSLKLEGEIVHCVPRELACAGARPGVAVQFDLAASELHSNLEPFVEALTLASTLAEDGPERAAPRSVARVPASLSSASTSTEIGGRTRNLSLSGALISIEGNALPDGQSVNLSLTNPSTGEEMKLEGTVVRSVEREDGDVAALGVAFDAPADQRPEIDHFVTELQAEQHRKRLGGISGELGEVGLANLLQMFGMCAAQGTLSAQRGAEEGILAFEAGLLRHSQLGAARGVKALARMLAWEDGHFDFEARIDADLRGEVPLPLEGAILDATRLLDESRRVETRDFPAHATLAICSEAAEAARSELGKLEEAVLELAMVGMCVGKILDVIPEPDAEIYSALAGLSERQVIRVQS